MKDTIFFIIIAVAACFAFFGVGLLLRGRSRWLQVLVTVGVMLLVFLSVSLFASSVAIDLFGYYQADPCGDATPQCVAEREAKQAFEARSPSLTFWLLVPKSLRPACETISPEFCVLQKDYDYAYVGEIFGAISAGVAGFLVFLGINKKRKNTVVMPLISPQA